MSLAHGRVLLHLAGRRRRVVEAEDIYYLEAQGDETDVRLRAARRLRDVRSPLRGRRLALHRGAGGGRGLAGL
ncbi:MAG: hypothetical protein LJF30_12830 [Acidobacteria bacterium]|nr:hypothetical protein [Acidobacteriota bacterium]